MGDAKKPLTTLDRENVLTYVFKGNFYFTFIPVKLVYMVLSNACGVKDLGGPRM